MSPFISHCSALGMTQVMIILVLDYGKMIYFSFDFILRASDETFCGL